MSDADIVTNAVSPTSGPLPMGEIPFENYRFANREFFLNCVDYLVSNNGIFQSRNKDFTLRLLDKKKVEEQRTTWQFINIVAPIAVTTYCWVSVINGGENNDTRSLNVFYLQW